MEGEKYAIGIDFGTESGRAVLVSLRNGEVVSDHVTPYTHGVIDQKLPNSNVFLKHDWALQHPLDYIDVINTSVPEVLRMSKVDPQNIVGIGIDFTACTMLPINKNMEPLCLLEPYRENPNSWVKLWKHHAAQKYANLINSVAELKGEEFLPRYGGKLSSEWMLAKIWQILDEAPDVYEATDQFVEAVDWVTYKLTGKLIRNSCSAGYKAIWHKQKGYPSKEFLRELDLRLENLVETKLRGEVVPIGDKAGGLTKEMAEATGLLEGTAVAVGIIDAHATVPAMGVVEEGKMVLSMGTSICHMLIGKEEKLVEGMCGVVEDGIIPGYFGYEAGQSAGGDMFAWYVRNGVPKYVEDAAREEGLSVHQYLEERASKLKPGENGLLALDWWNGNRSVLVDAELSGLIVGYSLQTKPEEVYRALLESTAFGTRKIIEAFIDNEIEITELYACGGLPEKNKLLMQIFADVTNKPIKIADSKHTPALGAAMLAAVAAGEEKGGYKTLYDAAKNMARVKKDIFKPIPENVEIYNTLYEEYDRLHNYFGRGENNVMRKLKELRNKN